MSLTSPNIAPFPPAWYVALEQRTTAGVKLGLERMQRALSAAGHPERRFPSILIAGTNGKGSVAAMWDAGLRAARKRVGRYTSPHLVRFTERMTVDGKEISWPELNSLNDRLVELEQVVAERLTFFEAATFFALQWFAEQRVDVAVLEVGLGGRLDSTNSVDPVLSVITSIGFDHMEYLGDSLGAIAGEKAGIFRPGVPAVVGPMAEEALEALRTKAESLGAPLYVVDEHRAGEAELVVGGASLPSLRPTLRGAHQQSNALTYALSATVAPPVCRLTEDEMRRGLLADWPGRLEVREMSGKPLVLDGAHNAQGIAALAEAVRNSRVPTCDVLVFGVVQGEGKLALLPTLAPLFKHVILVPPPTPRAAPLSTVAAGVGNVLACRDDAMQGVREALSVAQSGVMVAGSLYLIGAVRAALDGAAREDLVDFR